MAGMCEFQVDVFTTAVLWLWCVCTFDFFTLVLYIWKSVLNGQM